ncbi:MAG TPA: SDR family oxidoreductase [Clostridiales bacterium]|nr:SDR family oxidoreductase [Clostridiales bacterium]
MKKHILVTGASRGLGLFLSQKYLEDGNIVYAGVRDIKSPNIEALKKTYPEALIPVLLDVADTNSVNEAGKTIESYTDKLDVVINNAGIHSPSSFEVIERADIDECVTTFNINSAGPLRVVKACLHLLRNSKKGKIINISSESGSIGTCGRIKEYDYNMSKAALNMATKILSNYLKDDNIIALTVHPGWMRTDMGGSHAALDPYETACKLVTLFESINSTDNPVFIDNDGNEYPW